MFYSYYYPQDYLSIDGKHFAYKYPKNRSYYYYLREKWMQLIDTDGNKKKANSQVFICRRTVKEMFLTDSYQQFTFYEIDTMLRPFFNVLLFVRIFFTWETINYYRSCVYSHLTLRHKAIAIKIIDNCITIIIVIAYLIHAYFCKKKKSFYFLHLDMRSIKTLKFLCCVKNARDCLTKSFFQFWSMQALFDFYFFWKGIFVDCFWT